MQVNALPGSYERKSIRYLIIWTQVNASPVRYECIGIYGRKSMQHLKVMDISQCVAW